MQKQEILTPEERLEIRRAMIALGGPVARTWAYRFKNVGYRRWAVMYNDKCHGIYDLERHTFVD